MSYFPFYMEVKGKKCLVAGGGKVALRKVEKLLPFGVQITAVAPEFCPELERLEPLRLERRCFEPSDLEGVELVIAATDNRPVNAEISRLCRERGIPVNVVDNPELCSFYFPALIKREELCIGISTGGTSPLTAAFLRERIEQSIPDNLEWMLEQMAEYRQRLRDTVAEPSERTRLLKERFAELLEKGEQEG